MKRIFVVLGAGLALLIAAVAALSFLVDANSFRPLLEKELSTALAREVRLGNLRLALLKGSVEASDLSIAEDPAYGTDPFIRAKSLGVGVELWPLITSRQLRITGLTIDQPAIRLIQSASGDWNMDSLGGAARKSPAKAAPPADSKSGADLSVKAIRIKGAELSVLRGGRRSRPLTLRDVSLEVDDFSGTSAFPFELNGKVDGGGTVALQGKAGPLNQGEAAGIPLACTLKVAGLDLAGSGLNQNAPAFAGLVSCDAKISSDSRTGQLEGSLQAEKLRLSKQGTPSSKPVALAFALDHDMRRRSGRMRKGEIKIGSASAHMTGAYGWNGDVMTLRLNLDGPGMPVDELSALLPAMAVVLPRGSSLQGGTLTAKCAIEGPVDRLAIDGMVSLDNTKLTGFDLGRKLEFLEALAGIKPVRDTEIQTLGASLRQGPEGARVENLRLVAPAIGSLEGSGTISPANDLAFQMRATVQTVSVPFLVQGTASDPAFRPDVKGLARDQLNRSTERVKGLLKGLFNRK